MTDSKQTQCLSCVRKDEEIQRLKSMLNDRDEKIRRLEFLHPQTGKTEAHAYDGISAKNESNNSYISRFSRQIILPEIGVSGQQQLKTTSVLIVGAGGLGCPVGLYLAAAGIGKLGVLDYDIVEVNNLHRQVLHTEYGIGTPKCDSFIHSIKQVNSATVCVPYRTMLTSNNAKEILENYDIIVDASDNVPTRYLVNDCSVMLKKALVSGSALRLEGQLTVYNYKGGPCYRCMYPMPPLPDATTNCSEAGVLGPVTGIIGCLQALEVIKIAVGLTPSYVNKMLYFDGESGKFHVFNLRSKKENCVVCGVVPNVKHLIDYETFCQTSACDKVKNISLLPDSSRVTCAKYKEIQDTCVPHLLVDVRPSSELEICCISPCINIPISKLLSNGGLQILKNKIQESKNYDMNFVICRRGNDSQKAVKFLQEHLYELNVKWYDIKGGLESWQKEIDSDFPVYW